MTPLDVGFHSVFETQSWAASVSFAELEFPIQQASWHPELFHSDNVPHQTKLGLNEHGLDAGGLGTLYDLNVGDMVLPADSECGMESSHLVVLQPFDVSAIQCPCPTTVEEGGEYYSIVDL